VLIYREYFHVFYLSQNARLRNKVQRTIIRYVFVKSIQSFDEEPDITYAQATGTGKL